MTSRILWIVGAVVLILAHAPNASAQAVGMECRAGRYAETTKSVVGGASNCARKGTGWGLAIEVKSSPSAYTDDPACGQGNNTDQLARELALAASAERTKTWVSDFKEFWGRFLRRASSFGGNFGSLAQGAFIGKSGSRCQIFLVPVPVPASRITAIEFQAGQGAKPALPCFRTGVRRSGDSKDPYAIAKTSGTCEVGASGWRSGVVLDDKGGAVVAAVFKNWSTTLSRTGVLWVWY